MTDPVLSDGAAGFTPGISERRSSATKYLHEDFLGSTTRLTDASQATTDTRQYDAFGNVVSSSGSNPLPFAFAGGWGYQTDSDSGLQLLGHRYYDPSTGRFITRDPARDGRNWYGYGENAPDRLLDPEGLVPGWISKTWTWITDTGKTVGKIVGVITIVKPIAAAIETTYEGAINSNERRKMDKLYDEAHENGKINDEQWYSLKRNNNASAWDDGKNMWERWWHVTLKLW